MLQIKNVTITHKRNLRTIIENFSYVLNPGDKTVIIGEEGNGKSTLLKLLCDMTHLWWRIMWTIPGKS